MFIDTHCHLTDERYEDIEKEISSFSENDVEMAITVGYDYESSERGVAIANAHDNVYAVIGVHPHDSKLYTDEMEERLRVLAKAPKVAAYGEIGLDYFYDLSERDVQREVFRRQLKLSAELKLPVVLHVRDAYLEALEILTEHREILKYGILLHCYSGSREMLERFLKLGVYVSFSGAITFKNNVKADGCIDVVPMDRIFAETDSPYLTPVPFRGKLNRPIYVRYVAEKIAAVKGIETLKLCEVMRNNVKEFFKI